MKALWAIGGEVPVDAARFAASVEKLELVVVQAMNVSPFTAAAHVLLPTAAHVEDEGTFTQQDGITQRFRRAYPPKGEVQPGWRWVSAMSKALGLPVTYGSAREVWKALSRQGRRARLVRLGQAGPGRPHGPRHQPDPDRRRRPAGGLPRVRRAAREGYLVQCGRPSSTSSSLGVIVGSLFGLMALDLLARPARRRRHLVADHQPRLADARRGDGHRHPAHARRAQVVGDDAGPRRPEPRALNPRPEEQLARRHPAHRRRRR